jgi:predicted nucleic acid-binding protein
MRGSNSTPFIDSNCWLYLYLPDQDPPKREQFLRELDGCKRPTVSTQVLAEIGANLYKKAKVPEEKLRGIFDEMVSQTTVISVTAATMYRASHLRAEGTWSYWDSIIVSSALEANCDELWSEDFQNDYLVEGRLRILNPFIG